MGECFIAIEDETGYANFVVIEKLFEGFREEILHARLLMVEGRLQREDDLLVLTLTRGDEKDAPYPSQNKRAQVRNDGSGGAKDVGLLNMARVKDMAGLFWIPAFKSSIS